MKTVPCVLGVVVMIQVLAVLWLKALALSAGHHADTLGDATSGEIGRVKEDIAQTQKKIMTLSSPAQLKKWADERGWKLATPDKVDDVTKREPASVGSRNDSSTRIESDSSSAPGVASHER